MVAISLFVPTSRAHLHNHVGDAAVIIGYLNRWQQGLANGSKVLRPLEGLRDASTRWIVTHDFAEWKDEIAWMSLYFTVAVWSSLALCVVSSLGVHLPR